MSAAAVVYEYKTCPMCGIHYAVDKVVMAYRAKAASSENRHWYCPNGHRLVLREYEADKLQRERDRLAQRIAEKDDEIAERDRRLVAAKGQMTKLQKRVSAGVCPCCTRSFQNLRRHIATKHPGYAAENVVQFKAESA